VNYSIIRSPSNLYLLGDVLFNNFSFSLILSGLILLVAMIGSILLTVDLSYHNISIKKTNALINTKERKNRVSFWGIHTKKKTVINI
jgi:hypothetical protein